MSSRYSTGFKGSWGVGGPGRRGRLGFRAGGGAVRSKSRIWAMCY